MGITKVVNVLTGKVSFKTFDGVVLDEGAARSGLGFGHFYVCFIEWSN
jgi:hypothetical protein